MERMRTAIEETKSAIRKAQDDMKRYYDRRRTPAPVRATGHKTPGESSEIRMGLQKGYSTLYTFLNVRVSRIGAKLVCLSITSKQAKVALEGCHAVQG